VLGDDTARPEVGFLGRGGEPPPHQLGMGLWSAVSSPSGLLVAVMSCVTVRRQCDCFIASLAPFINIQIYLLTYPHVLSPSNFSPVVD